MQQQEVMQTIQAEDPTQFYPALISTQLEARRSNADYTDWLSPEAEDPTQFYPEFLIFCYPKRYTVSCQKDSAKKKTFPMGYFPLDVAAT